MSPVNTLNLNLNLSLFHEAAMVWYVMCTFCHWYKGAGTHCLIILKLQTAEQNSKKGLF